MAWTMKDYSVPSIFQHIGSIVLSIHHCLMMRMKNRFPCLRLQPLAMLSFASELMTKYFAGDECRSQGLRSRPLRLLAMGWPSQSTSRVTYDLVSSDLSLVN